MGLLELKSRCQQGYVSDRSSRGKFLILPASRAVHIPCFVPASLWPLLLFSHLFSDSDPCTPTYKGALCVHWTHQDNPWYFLHWKILNLITPAKFLLPCKVTFTGSRDYNVDILWHYSAYDKEQKDIRWLEWTYYSWQFSQESSWTSGLTLTFVIIKG